MAIKKPKIWRYTLVPIGLIVLAGASFAGWTIYQKNLKPLPTKDASGNLVNYDHEAAREMTGGDCSGAGAVSIIAPMRLDQLGFILPYGLMVGGHVTPVDHQYFNGLDGNNSLRDTYDVLAPADGTLINIEHRGNAVNTPPHTKDNPSSDEYRLTIVHTCSFITTLDLQTSLSDEIKAKLPAHWDPKQGWHGHIAVKRGQLLGRIGGQTLDFFVWDLSHKLTGFVNPAQYDKAEGWKTYTAPVSQYYDPSIKDQVLAKYVRTAQPIDGKIDYDIDGKLIGNWFLEGSGGYGGKDAQKGGDYWSGHLAIAPDYLDPSVFHFSIGNYGSYKGASNHDQDPASNGNSGAEQFITLANAPDPAKVDQSAGLVKYELVKDSYVKTNGLGWDGMSFATNLKLKPAGSVLGTVIVQLMGPQTLKFEAFPGQRASAVSGFDANAKTYTR